MNNTNFTCFVVWSCIDIRNLSITLQLFGIGELCLITISTNILGPILPSGSMTEYFVGAVHKTKRKINYIFLWKFKVFVLPLNLTGKSYGLYKVSNCLCVDFDCK